jgi:hypothetical protein
MSRSVSSQQACRSTVSLGSCAVGSGDGMSLGSIILSRTGSGLWTSGSSGAQILYRGTHAPQRFFFINTTGNTALFYFKNRAIAGNLPEINTNAPLPL